MKQQYYLIGFILWAFTSPMQAQEPTLKTFENEQIEKGCIEDVNVQVEKAKIMYESDELYKKLGDIYYFDNNYEEASKWYKKLYVANSGMLEPEYLMRYSMSLKNIGNKILAAKINDEYMNISGSITVLFPSSFDDSDSYEKKSILLDGKFSPIPKGSNDGFVENEFQDVSDYNYYGKKKRSSRRTKKRADRSGKNGHGNSTKINLHESSVVITKDGNTMYFTRPHNILNLTKSDRARLRIYRSTKVNGSWGDIEDLPINGDHYSNAHPVLGLDEKTLFFSSDMPSSYGETDIYAVAIKDNGSLGEPRNLGPKVNTVREESFPFVSSDKGLYFSSNGHYGNGGFDVYYTDLQNTDKGSLNLGKSINGPHDDFALPSFGRFGLKTDLSALSDTELVKGFFYMKIEVTVIDVKTGKPINGARVVIIDDNEIEKKVVKTNGDGSCMLHINRFKAYMLKVERKEYESTYKYISKGNSNRGLHLELKQSKLLTLNKTNRKE